MKEGKVKLDNLCPVFISNDIQKTVNYYVEELGFKFAKHYDKTSNFATIYRDSIEFVILQAKYGKAESNTQKYGVGYDAYIDPDTVEGVDGIIFLKEVKTVIKLNVQSIFDNRFTLLYEVFCWR
jgi:catechol 2,3-dioxygenase-like lactoylglutathione lyase family enzyme